MPHRLVRPTRILLLALAAGMTIAPAQSGAALTRRATSHGDPRDVAGPLDLDSASFDQHGSQLALRVHTRGQWRPHDLDAVPGRSLCLNLFARTGSGPRATLCVTGRPRSARAALRFSRLTPAGGVLSTRTLTAGVH
ncbi:MAG: hypothetical protein QOK04_2569, partial [Solirubrobacteraceae bacterium]|nr:hypothetical protein [Solirubrobacteraceae bacterium]